jgi:hypothetical protein
MGYTLRQVTFFRPRAGTEIPFESSSSSVWPLPVSGPAATHIKAADAGFGPEYWMEPRDSFHSSATVTTPPPSEVEDAWTCEMTANPALCDGVDATMFE